MASSRRRPGWYPDPEEATRYRWWSGTGWTPALADSDEAPPPSEAMPEVPPRARRFPWIMALLGGLVLGVFGTLTGIGLIAGSPWQTVASPSLSTPETVQPISIGSAVYERATMQILLLEGRVVVPAPTEPWVATDMCSDASGLFASVCHFADMSFTEPGSDPEPSITPPMLSAGVLDEGWVGAMSMADTAEALLEEYGRRAHSGVDDVDLTVTSVAADPQVSEERGTRGEADIVFTLDGVDHQRHLMVRVFDVYPGARAAVLLLTDELMEPDARSVGVTCLDGAKFA